MLKYVGFSFWSDFNKGTVDKIWSVFSGSQPLSLYDLELLEYLMLFWHTKYKYLHMKWCFWLFVSKIKCILLLFSGQRRFKCNTMFYQILKCKNLTPLADIFSLGRTEFFRISSIFIILVTFNSKILFAVNKHVKLEKKYKLHWK